MPEPSRPRLTSDQFDDLLARLRRTEPARPGENALAAAQLISTGTVVSCGQGPALPASDTPAPHGVPHPVRLAQYSVESGDHLAVCDRFEVDLHGALSMTHVDALEHFYWRGLDFSGRPVPGSDRGSLVHEPAVDVMRPMVGRGVLIDLPAVCGGSIPPGEVATLDDLRAAICATGVAISPGAFLHIRFGFEGPRDSATFSRSEPVPGLGLECAEWLAGLAPALVLTDLGLDAVPSEVHGVRVPWHIILLAHLGIPLVDLAALGSLADTCRDLERYEFCSVVSALPLHGASGSPVQPIAIF